MRFPGVASMVLWIGCAAMVHLPSGAAESRSNRSKTSHPKSTPAAPTSRLSTEQLATRAKASLVMLSTRGRDGTGEGIGTGFVIDSTGLIATSLHVVGEARPVTARLASGQELEVVAVQAFDRHTDLAILRVAATNLTALPLADSSTLALGAEVVALGNPMGLENSVVAGVLSGRRVLDEVEMLQIAIPIEPGNSGGPLLDRTGKVHGIVNAKSMLTRNLGFATPINLLKPLLEHPHPVPFTRWVRTGKLNPEIWETHLGARWRQRGGLIQVEGQGSGFGGRSFLLHHAPAPEAPYEVTVTVRLQEESGAAGLVFGGDDSGIHYGFYPTGGQLRLTAFEGDEVFSWRILGTVPSTAYRPGDWNTLRVRQESNRIVCWVNGTEVFSRAESRLQGRRVGLTQFRNTTAEFRNFLCATNVQSETTLPPGLAKNLGGTEIPKARWGEEEWKQMRAHLKGSQAFLAERAQTLEQEASRLRKLSTQLHREQVREELVEELARGEKDINLPRAALLVARLDNPDLDIAFYLRQLDQLGAEVRSQMQDTMPDREKVNVLRRFLFEENGFHGSRHDYSNRANSHLNEVLEDREGLPITLSFVFLALAERAGIADVWGVPLPGHFLVKHAPPDGPEQLIDLFNEGRYLTHSDADELGTSFTRMPVRSEFIRPASKREMMVRLLTNLQSFTERESGAAESMRYADLLVAIAGDSRSEAAQRVDRARLRTQSGDLKGAREDLSWVLEAAPPGMDTQRLQEMIRQLGGREE